MPFTINHTLPDVLTCTPSSVTLGVSLSLFSVTAPMAMENNNDSNINEITTAVFLKYFIMFFSFIQINYWLICSDICPCIRVLDNIGFICTMCYIYNRFVRRKCANVAPISVYKRHKFNIYLTFPSVCY